MRVREDTPDLFFFRLDYCVGAAVPDVGIIKMCSAKAPSEYEYCSRIFIGGVRAGIKYFLRRS